MKITFTFTSVFVLALASCKPPLTAGSQVRTAVIPKDVDGMALKVLMMPEEEYTVEAMEEELKLRNKESKYLIAEDVQVLSLNSYHFAGYATDANGKLAATTQIKSGPQKCDVVKLEPGTDEAKIPLFLCRADGSVATAKAKDRTATISASIRGEYEYRALKNTFLYKVGQFAGYEYAVEHSGACEILKDDRFRISGQIDTGTQKEMRFNRTSPTKSSFFLIKSISGKCAGKDGLVLPGDFSLMRAID